MERNNKDIILYIAQAAMIAAIYVALTFIFAPISFNLIQIRIAEALCIMPLFTSAAIPGLYIGCLLGNAFAGAAFYDVIFGSLATLLGAIGGYVLRRNRWLVPIPSIISNMLIVPFILKYVYMVDVPIFIQMLYIGFGEFVGCYVLGEILGTALLKHAEIFKKRNL